MLLVFTSFASYVVCSTCSWCKIVILNTNLQLPQGIEIRSDLLLYSGEPIGFCQILSTEHCNTAIPFHLMGILSLNGKTVKLNKRNM